MTYDTNRLGSAPDTNSAMITDWMRCPKCSNWIAASFEAHMVESATGARWCPGAASALVAAHAELQARVAELEEWFHGAQHQPGCSGDHGYQCKCGLAELLAAGTASA